MSVRDITTCDTHFNVISITVTNEITIALQLEVMITDLLVKSTHYEVFI